MTTLEKCKEIGYKNLTHDEKFEVLQAGIQAQGKGENEEASRIRRLIPLTKEGELTLKYAYGEDYIKKQGYLLEDY